MIEAVIMLIMEAEEIIEGIKHRTLVLVIQSKSGIIKATVHDKGIDFMLKEAKVKTPEELAGKAVMLDLDANYSCIYVILSKKRKPGKYCMTKATPVPCEISLIKKFPKH